MANAPPNKRYVLSAAARRDLRRIEEFFEGNYSLEVARRIVREIADVFALLARNPGLGHPRREWVGDRPRLFWPVRDLIVVYRANTDPLLIVLVVRGSRDLPVILSRRNG